MDLLNNNHTTIFLHQNIRCLRRKLQLSQEELAGRVGLNRGNIASYENGTAEPKICNLLKLSSLFGVSIMDLTQNDLSDEDTFTSATNNYQKVSKSERELIKQYMRKADELQEVIRSIHTCQQFKTKSLEELPKDLKFFILNFEQLYDAAQSLLRNHQSLLDFIKCRMK